MKTLKFRLRTNWHFLRILRVLLGILMVIQTFVRPDMLSGLLGVILLYQGITDSGCCGSNGCAVPEKRDVEKAEQNSTLSGLK